LSKTLLYEEAKMSSPGQEIHDLIYQIFRSRQSSDRETCACYGVTPLQSMVLIEVDKQPLGMQQLAKHLQLAVSTMTRVVDKLVDAGFINRQEDKNDRRQVLCTLTEKGRKTAKQLEGCYNKFFDKVAADISSDELQGFLKGLRVMVNRLQGLATSCGCSSEKK
jgi:DNA-binding MarR family transcriptional regulator